MIEFQLMLLLHFPLWFGQCAKKAADLLSVDKKQKFSM